MKAAKVTSVSRLYRRCPDSRGGPSLHCSLEQSSMDLRWQGPQRGFSIRKSAPTCWIAVPDLSALSRRQCDTIEAEPTCIIEPWIWTCRRRASCKCSTFRPKAIVTERTAQHGSTLPMNRRPKVSPACQQHREPNPGNLSECQMLTRCARAPTPCGAPHGSGNACGPRSTNRSEQDRHKPLPIVRSKGDQQG